MSERGSAQARGPAFLFDLDGTLVDSVYQHVLVWRYLPHHGGRVCDECVV